MTGLPPSPHAAPPGSLCQALREVYERLIRHQNAKDMQALLHCMHAESPWRESTRQLLEPFLDHYSLLDFRLIGYDEDYAYCRSRQSVERIAGPDFKDLISDNLVACRRQGEQWKVWQQMVLGMQTLTRGDSK